MVRGSWFATTFALCFEMREGMLLFCGFQLLTALFWVSTISFSDGCADADCMLRLSTITVLALNSFLGMNAVKTNSERFALALCITYSVLIMLLLVELSRNMPVSCESKNVMDDTAIGLLLSQLFWTADACLLMTIMGWITIAVAFSIVVYLWYMCICFWKLIRSASSDQRRVRRLIMALPVRRYKALELETCDGSEDDEGSSNTGTCAICISEFSAGEEVRVLPCEHEFCKQCIDPWIRQQGLRASCPLCKRLLLPQLPAAASPDDEETAMVHSQPRSDADSEGDDADAGPSSRLESFVAAVPVAVRDEQVEPREQQQPQQIEGRAQEPVQGSSGSLASFPPIASGS